MFLEFQQLSLKVFQGKAENTHLLLVKILSGISEFLNIVRHRKNCMNIMKNRSLLPRHQRLRCQTTNTQ